MSDAQPDRPAESTDGTGSLSDDLNELCHEVIQALDAGALVVDSSLRILAANPTLLGWCRQWGWEVDVVGKDVFSVFSFLPDSVRDEFNHVLRTGESVTVERALTIGDHELIFEARKTPIRRDGQVAGVVLIIREITALKQAQRDKDHALARLEEFESIVNRSPAVVFLWRAGPADEWPVEFVSENVRQFGYTPEDFTSGRVSWTSVTYPQDVPQLEADVAAHIEQGDSTFSQEYRLIDASGAVRWVEDRNLIIRDAEGAIAHIQGIILDITERRHAKIKLRDSEEKYRVLVESAEEAIFAMDAEGTYLFMNATAAAAVGGSPEDFVGKTMWDVFPKGVADRQAQTVRTVIESGQPMIIETPTIIGGQQRWYRTSLAPLPDHTGKVTAALLIARDVTAKKEAEEALRQSEEQFRHIAESMADWIWEVDANGVYAYASEKVQAVLGYTSEEMLGKTPFDLMPPDEARRVGAVFADICANKRPIRDMENWNVTKDGRHVCLLTNGIPLLGPEGELLGYRGVDRDITERKEAEGALLASEERYRKLFEQSNDAVVIAGPGGHIVDVNGRACEMFGYSPEQLAGRLITDLHPPAERARDRQLFENLTDQGAVRFEMPCLRADGTIFDSEISARVVDPDKGIAQGIIRDITERKQAQRALQEAHEKLVNAREAERRRLARELHDSVSQDLVAIQVAIQNAAAAGRGSLDSNQMRALAGAADKCTQLVREVRDICYALYPPTLETLGLVASIRQLGHYCEKQAEFTLTFSPGLDKERFGDVCEIALYRIAQEAVNNALRHAGAQRIAVSLTGDADGVTLQITDDGCGFDPAACAGRGLGLASMNDRAKAAGGELTITSASGRTCVQVRVPLTRPGE